LPLRVVSVYVPHGRTLEHWHYGYKLTFLDALTARVAGWLMDDAHVVVAGDVNVAPTNSDVFHPDAFAGATHVSPPERQALARLLDVGLVDVDVARWGPRARRFTWWNHGIGYSATSACASTTSPSTWRSPDGWTLCGSTTLNAAGYGRPTTPP
jgi:exodeoxyribonuclease-3